MRLIDGDALSKETGKLWEQMSDGEELSKELMKAINRAPTVDAVPVEEIARLLADTFSSPCNFSPLDEEMYDVCGKNCDMDDEKCWARWIKLKMDGERREDDAKEST